MTSNVEPLLRHWLDLKQAEDDNRAARLKIEEQLLGTMDVPFEGSKTHHIGSYKVTVTRPVIRKLDADMWENVKTKIPAHMAPVRTKLEAEPAGCKYLADNEPEMWSRIATAFTVKPGKIGFKVVEEQTDD